MCLQCISKAETVLNDAVPGYTLMVATLDTDHWRKGEWGLVNSNDPDFIWSGDPLINPIMFMTEKELEQVPKTDPLWDAVSLCDQRVEEIEKRFRAAPMIGYKFVQACLRAGYDPNVHGERIVLWFIDHVARKIAEKKR